MWCNHCQQDVPGVATLGKTDGAKICCARCGRMVATKPLRADGPPAESTDVNRAMLDSPPVLTFDDWQVETQLQRIATLAGHGSSSE